LKRPVGSGRTAALLVAVLPALLAAACADGRSGRAADVAAVLDDWHAAAAAADEARYFGHFTADAVFLGTDAEERFTVERFRAYAHPHFAAGTGWTYVPRDRQVAFAESGDLAWFDERLDSPKYGELRGTGVLRREGGAWRIAHYSMTFTVPNDVSGEVVERIAAGKAQGTRR
jgi:ketosteroid isomerase-like protein